MLAGSEDYTDKDHKNIFNIQFGLCVIPKQIYLRSSAIGMATLKNKKQYDHIPTQKLIITGREKYKNWVVTRF